MSDLPVFRGFEPDKVLAELVHLGQLDRRLVGTAWCNRDKKSRAAIIQKLTGQHEKKNVEPMLLQLAFSKLAKENTALSGDGDETNGSDAQHAGAEPAAATPQQATVRTTPSPTQRAPCFSQNEDIARLIHLIQEPAALEWIHFASANAFTDNSQRRRSNLDAHRAGTQRLEDPWERIADLFNDYETFKPENPYAHSDIRLSPFLSNRGEIERRMQIRRSALELRAHYSKLRGMFTPVYERFRASGHHIGEGSEQEVA